MEELQPQDIDDLLQELEEEEAEAEPMAEGDAPSPADDVAQRLERAFALEDEGEYDKALDECETALRLDPHLADVHNLRGVILEELGREEEAVLAYREALRLDPDFDAARENLEAVEAELQAEENGPADQTSRFWVEEQVVFEAEYETGSYPWQLSRVEMDSVADAITIHGLPDGTPTIPIHLSEVVRCEMVTRPDLRRGLANMWVSGAPERADGGDALMIVLTEIADRIIAGSSKVPVVKLTHAGGSDSNPGLLEIHLRSMKRGREGKIATLELGQRLAAFLRRAGWEGAIPAELSAPVAPEAVPGGAVAEPAEAKEPADSMASLQRTGGTRRSRVVALRVSVLLSLPVICCASSLWVLGGAAGYDQVLYSMGDSLYKLGYPLTMIVIKFPEYTGRYLTTKDDLWAIPLVSLLFVVQWVIWGQLIVAGIRRLRARHD